MMSVHISLRVGDEYLKIHVQIDVLMKKSLTHLISILEQIIEIRTNTYLDVIHLLIQSLQCIILYIQHVCNN